MIPVYELVIGVDIVKWSVIFMYVKVSFLLPLKQGASVFMVNCFAYKVTILQ